jgi:hypothetical protein
MLNSGPIEHSGSSVSKAAANCKNVTNRVHIRLITHFKRAAYLLVITDTYMPNTLLQSGKENASHRI